MIRKAGFTLVELLVVMAIIAILASIAVPNVVQYIKKSRAVKAHSEIQSIELALTKMVTDADRNSLNDLFNPQGVDNILRQISDPMAQLEAATQIYTRTTYALLRNGRLAYQDFDTEMGISYSQVLLEPIVNKLGVSYLDLGFDPWGELYQIFPGPWKWTYNSNCPTPLIPFRTYLNPETRDQSLPGTRGSGRPDQLTATGTTVETNETMTVGYTAPLDKLAFIWSKGQNLQNNQGFGAVICATGRDAYAGSDIEFMGGGDDINNWDNNRTWERHYN